MPPKKITYSRPTTQDSLDVANSAAAVRDYYLKKGYALIDTKLYKDKPVSKKLKEYYKSLGIGHLSTFERGQLTNREAYEKFGPSFGHQHATAATGDIFRSVPTDLKDYYQKIDEFKYTQRDEASGRLDLRSPAPLYDTRITPTHTYHLRKKVQAEKPINPKDKGEDNVQYAGYDPIFLKPAHLKTKEDWAYIEASKKASQAGKELPAPPQTFETRKPTTTVSYETDPGGDYNWQVVDGMWSRPRSGKFAAGGSLGTALFPAQESAYQTWRSKLPKRLQYEGNYDLRGFWKENPKFTAVEGQHMTDKFKLPNHPTFSNGSQYYDETPGQGGYWKGDTFVPNPKIGPAMQKKRNGGPLVRGYLKKYAFGSPGPIEDETIIGGYPMQNDTASGDYNSNLDWAGVDRNASKPDRNKKSWGVSRQQVGNGVMAAGQIVRSMDKTTFGDFRDDTDNFTDGAMNIVGKIGPIGALIAGIYNIVQPISKGVRKRTEATDAFGNLTESKGKINRTATLGAILSPSQAIANRIALNYYKPGWGGYADALQKKLKEEFNEKQAPYVEANRLYAEGRAGLQGDYAQGIKSNQYYQNGGQINKHKATQRAIEHPAVSIPIETAFDQTMLGKGFNFTRQVAQPNKSEYARAINLGLEAVKFETPVLGDLLINTVQEGVQYLGNSNPKGVDNAYRTYFKQEKGPKYAHGGSLVSSYLKANGGTLNQLSKSTVEVQGPSHEEGGVQLPQVGAEVEGNETISNGYVFSDRLGFAQEHKKLARMQGKIEDKPATRERLNTLKLLKEKEGQLALAQEYLRKTLNLQ